MPLEVIGPFSKSNPDGPPSTSTLVTVPSCSSVELIVTVVPETLVVTFVPPVNVRLPDVVIAVPEPSSAAGVMLVTVPSY